MPLPESLPGPAAGDARRRAVTHNTWFGGIYQDPQELLRADRRRARARSSTIYPEYKLPPEQMKAWLADRQGAIVGRDARRALRLEGRRPHPDPGDDLAAARAAAPTWEFNIVGIYDGEPGVDKTQFFFRYDYLDENRAVGEGLVGWYIVKIDGPGAVAGDGADASTTMFANSPAETKTTTEKGFVEGFAKQIGDIGSIMIAILVGGVLHHPAGRRQHHGAGGARADQRAGRAEDAGLLRRHGAGAGARRVAVRRRRRRRARPARWPG